MTQYTLNVSNGTWLVRDCGEVNAYGRAIPTDRRLWAVHVAGDKPAHLAGVHGFHAPTHDAVVARIRNAR